MIASRSELLQGWKDIAAYLDRDESTVKRWEKQRGMPVRRIPGAGRANVYIERAELDAWLHEGKLTRRAQEANPSSATPSLPRHGQLISSAGSDPSPEPAELHLFPEEFLSTTSATPASRQVLSSRRLLFSITALSLLLVSGILLDRRHRPSTDTGLSDSAALPVPSANSGRARADDLYLEGVYFSEQRTPVALDRARRSFEEAITRNPTHALAYAGLSQTYLLMREYSHMPEAEAYLRAEASARRAIELEPTVAEAHATLGFIAFFFHWNPQQATAEFTTALLLDPDSAVTHQWFGSMLLHQRSFDLALQHLSTAQRLRPTSAAIVASRAYALGLSGHRDEAIGILQPLVSSDPGAPSPHRILATLSLGEPQNIPDYLREMRRFAEIRGDGISVQTFDLEADAYRRGGEKALWTFVLQREAVLHSATELPTFAMVHAEAALGRHEEALANMQILAKRHDLAMTGIDIDPLLAALRPDPRFQAVETAVGLH